MRLVEPDQRPEVDVRDAVAVRHQKGLIPQPAPQTQKPATGQRLQTGVDEVHEPVLGRSAVHGRTAVGEVDREIAPQVVIVEEIAAHHLRFVAERDHELTESVGGIDVHDVPENRMPPDLHHGLRT